MKRIDREDCSDEDKQLIKDIIFHCQAQGVSFGRLYKLSWTLLSVKRMMSFNFKEATRKDVEKLVNASVPDYEALVAQVGELTTSQKDLDLALRMMMKQMEPFMWLGRKLREEEMTRAPDAAQSVMVTKPSD